ncbi:tRNA (cytosine(32)/uridine(32)-2'-O)-methyltransferase TrmJ [Solemya velesiana gill symbiont]|uniref:tRNA (cytidine/uridine-2'-O-)-methyltransferase TrmJ n=1 Tax=Solemya velesiana gill symbiont TaxID=1918948 RepID=A0A1T2KTW3_9GAMM|nr:tRNA (cytosine(32)/uridine(32)-2'-O)-methyltransferase TrmJ [Solemya velesiana gill symbiont]OOZ36180.1 tRNA (cytosine(32)/uridine(32)-2'-O)-methyltransferase TrmJ [Solemya velesiana gill symbiont]
MLNNVRIVLIETSHPGNIGAVARAMKNMCLEHLYLVQPKHYPSAEATARASGADDLLARAHVCEDLDEALKGCHLVVGASARLRSVEWPQLNPRECAERAFQEAGQGEVALIFGRESSGLRNSELDRCQFLVHIPANEEYASLNLAQAVQVLSYEMHMASLQGKRDTDMEVQDVATAETMESFYGHLEQALSDIGFSDPRQSNKLQRRLRRLFFRARPDTEELNILRGILSAAQGRKSMRRSD